MPHAQVSGAETEHLRQRGEKQSSSTGQYEKNNVFVFFFSIKACKSFLVVIQNKIIKHEMSSISLHQHSLDMLNIKFTLDQSPDYLIQVIVDQMMLNI